MKNIIIALALVLGFGAQAFAKGGSGFTLIPSISHISETVTFTGDPEDSSSSLLISGKVGYTLASGLYLGGVYGSNSSSEESGGVTVKMTTNSFGASVGYIHSSGFNIIASYLLSVAGENDATPKLELTGSGFVIDAGYSFMFGSWGLGPQVSYSMITMDEVKQAGVVLPGIEGEIAGLGFGLQFLFMF